MERRSTAHCGRMRLQHDGGGWHVSEGGHICVNGYMYETRESRLRPSKTRAAFKDAPGFQGNERPPKTRAASTACMLQDVYVPAAACGLLPAEPCLGQSAGGRTRPRDAARSLPPRPHAALKDGCGLRRRVRLFSRNEFNCVPARVAGHGEDLRMSACAAAACVFRGRRRL